MKIRVLILYCLSFSPVLAGFSPAREAIRTVGRERGAGSLTRIVQVFGEQGMDQPKVWRIVTMQGQTLREYYVQGGNIVTDGPVPAASAVRLRGPSINLGDLTIDSSAAFTRAEAAAKAARIGFDSASYQLRALELSNTPAWFLTLKNSAGQKVGEVSIGGKSGRILRTAWFTPTRPQTTAQQAAPTASPFYRTRNVAGETVSKVGTNVRDGLSKATNWIRGKIAPAPAQPYYIPYRAR